MNWSMLGADHSESFDISGRISSSVEASSAPSSPATSGIPIITFFCS